MIHNICLDKENHEIVSIKKYPQENSKDKSIYELQHRYATFFYQVPQLATFSELAVRIIAIPSTLEIS